MSTQTGSISFEAAGGFNSYAKQNYATLSQIKGQFATSDTGAAIEEKIATIVPQNSGWALYPGATVTVKFTNENTKTTPKLNVNNTGAKEIRDYKGDLLEEGAYKWENGAAMSLTYDGTYWRIQDSNLMERVHTAETEINQTATSITSLATLEDTYTKPDGTIGTNSIKSQFTQTANAINAKVDKDGVIASINASVEEENGSQIKISADKVNIEGAAIFSSGRLSTTSLNNTYATSSTANTANATEETLYYASNSTTAPAIPTSAISTNSASTYNAWNLTLPTYSSSYPYLFTCLQRKSIGNTYSWTKVMQSSYAAWTSAINTTANNAAPKTSAVSRTQRIYYQSADTTKPATPGTASSNWVLDESGAPDKWTLKRMSYSSAKPYIYTCEQKQVVSGTVSYTPVLLDDTTTVIDGGKIITGSVTASALNADNINASKTLTIGAFQESTQNDILNSNIQVGGKNLLYNSSIITGSDYGSLSSSPIDGGIAGSEKHVESTKAWNGIGIALHTALQRAGAKIGDTVTMSIWVSNTSTEAISRDIYLYRAKTSSSTPGVNNSGGTNTYTRLSLKSGEWQRVYVTFEVTDYALNTVKTTRFETSVTDSTNKMLWTAPQLEFGNVVTDWRPAPEDTEASILGSGVEYIAGTQTAATGNWTGVTKETSLIAGKTIAYKLPYAGSGNASLQLKDENGNNVGGNIAVYSMTTRVTTHYPADSIIQMTYDGTYWRTSGWYNTNNVDRKQHNNYIKAVENIPQYRICAGTSSGYKAIAASTSSTPFIFDISYPLLYLNAANISGQTYALAANGQSTAFYEILPSVTVTNNGTVQSAAINEMVYLKGTLDGNTFKTAISNYLTCIIPTAETSPVEVYLPLGMFPNNSTTAIYFDSPRIMYAYVDGKFRQVTPTEIIATHRIYYRTTAANNSLAAPTTWIDEATANVYNTWTTKVPPLANGTDSSATGYTKYPYLYTCEQRKRLDGTVECTKVLLDENTTIIDGGSIITNSIAANTINANSGTFNTANIPNLDAAKITSGSISADRIKTNVVSAINATANKIDAKNINVSAINIGDLAGEVGGRNLLADSANLGSKWVKDLTSAVSVSDGVATLTKASSGNTRIYQMPASGYWTWTVGENYTVSVDARSDTNGCELLIHAVGASKSQTYNVTTEWRRYNFSFTPTSVSTGSLSFYNQGSTGDVMQLRFPKLENGNIATDWTPAPEDIDSAIDDASKVASNYISANSSGIRIASANPATQNQRLELTNSRVDFYNSDNVNIGAISGTVARFGPSNSARINIDSSNGVDLYDTANKKRVTINTGGLHIYNTDGTTETGLFGPAAARIGATTGPAFEMNADNLSAYYMDGTTRKLYFKVTPTSMSYGPGLNTTVAKTSDIPTTVAELSDSSSYLTTQTASTTYATQANLTAETNRRKAVYGTCSTVSGTAIKEVICNDFEPYAGARLTVLFSSTNNNRSSISLKIINSSGTELLAAKSIKNKNNTGSTTNPIWWGTNTIVNFRYVIESASSSYWAVETESLNYASTCTTSATEPIKAPKATSCFIVNGTTIAVRFSNANTYEGNLYLNVSGTGAQPIYVNNVQTSSTNPLKWSAGTELVFVQSNIGWYMTSRSDASETASAYITQDGTGIKVHSTSLLDYIHISPKNVQIYKEMSNSEGAGISSLAAEFGEEIILYDDYENKKIEIGTDGNINLYGRNNSINLYYGSDSTSYPNVTIESGGVYTYGAPGFYTRQSQKGFYVYEDSNLKTSILAGTINLYAGAGTYPKTTLNSKGVYNYYDANNYTQQSSDGFYLYQDGNPVATFGSTATIGKTTSKNVYIDSNSVNIRNGTTPVAIFKADGIDFKSGALGIELTSSSFGLTMEGGEAFIVRYNKPTTTNGTDWTEVLDFMEGFFFARCSGTASKKRLSCEGGPILFTDGTNAKYYNSSSGAITSVRPPATVRDATPTASSTAARASGANYQINITGTAVSNYMPIAVIAVTCSNVNQVLRGFDLDGISTGGTPIIKTYWRSMAAISSGTSLTYTAQVIFLKTA